MAKIESCPSCRHDVEKVEGGYFCPVCDCVYKITREGPKVEKLGVIDELANRVTNLEGKIGDGPAAPTDDAIDETSRELDDENETEIDEDIHTDESDDGDIFQE